jgi:hypothetical protein
MKPRESSDEYPKAETARRMEDAIRRALATKPTPHAKVKGKKNKVSKAT